jgi:glycosyltransferase involved in cell wall biosynthesis
MRLIMENSNYILVTPCKNEENNLLNLYKSLSTQIIRPVLWVIVDDGSIDKTPQIINDILTQNAWVSSLRLESGKRDVGKHVYGVYNAGFKFAKEYCALNNINYSYIGNIDADMVLRENNYFQEIIAAFESNNKIGIMSSTIYYMHNDKLVRENNRDNLPMGSPRIWSKKCFDETGGYPYSYSADSVSNVIAKKKGWDLLILDTIAAIQSRRTSSAGGLWNGFIINGKSAYYRNYSTLFVILKSIKLCFVNPYYIGLAYFYGFFISTVRREEKFENQEVLIYYHDDKLNEIFLHYFRTKLLWFLNYFSRKK